MDTKKYKDQASEWPGKGKHIIANYNDETITVYQAFRPEIGHIAEKNQCLEVDGFSVDRMTWIKPNFLWMMARSGWGTKIDQEVILGISIFRKFFNEILSNAVSSSFEAGNFETEESWRSALDSTDAVFQWDPSRSPSGRKLNRKSIQLGLRGRALKKYISRDSIKEIIDISNNVSEMHNLVNQGKGDEILMPIEKIYPVPNPGINEKLGLNK